MTLPKNARSDPDPMPNQPLADPPVIKREPEKQLQPPVVRGSEALLPGKGSNTPSFEKPDNPADQQGDGREVAGSTDAPGISDPPLAEPAATTQKEMRASEAPERNDSPSAAPPRRRLLLTLIIWLGRTIRAGWDTVCLLLLLALVSAVPILQLASLGYLLTSAKNLALGKPWRKALPGRRRAGRLGAFVGLAFVLWLPVWLVTDLAYTAQLLQPNSRSASLWRIGAFFISFAWVVHIGWAAMRGARWYQLLWPAPIRFLKQVWRPSLWSEVSDRLYDWVAELELGKLWWLGARAAIGALLWIAIPVSMMIIGQRAYELPVAPLIGLVGAISMFVVMFYLPFLQIQLAIENRMLGIVNFAAVRRRFRYAPLVHAIALCLLCFLSLPLYLLRIEATPAELLWAPSIVFVLFMLPVKAGLGAAMSVGERRALQERKSHWVWRWLSRALMAASVLIYVGALYFAQLIAGQGALVMYFQHALLVPAPLISS